MEDSQSRLTIGQIKVGRGRCSRRLRFCFVLLEVPFPLRSLLNSCISCIGCSRNVFFLFFSWFSCSRLFFFVFIVFILFYFVCVFWFGWSMIRGKDRKIWNLTITISFLTRDVTPSFLYFSPGFYITRRPFMISLIGLGIGGCFLLHFSKVFVGLLEGKKSK